MLKMIFSFILDISLVIVTAKSILYWYSVSESVLPLSRLNLIYYKQYPHKTKYIAIKNNGVKKV
jgi:hypothetical protein